MKIRKNIQKFIKGNVPQIFYEKESNLKYLHTDIKICAYQINATRGL